MPPSAALAELEPSGIRDLPRRAPVQRICGECLVNLFLEPHDPVCTRDLVWLRDALLPAELRRAEDALEKATRRAHAAWVKEGCRP